MVTTTAGLLLADVARACVAAVLDPELPMVTIEDLGILRDVRVEDDVVHVTITPTYAGCPAMDAIRSDIGAAVQQALPGRCAVVHTVLAPAWSTDDLTDDGRRKLAEAGIAPPGVSTGSTTGGSGVSTGSTTGGSGVSTGSTTGGSGVSTGSTTGGPGVPTDSTTGGPGVSTGSTEVALTLTIRCPQCGSPDTRELSRFGSTACKALWVCNACAEPFDSFKQH
jgi:ring-1,2-phenylacetyl-CoA epoxidase subunit PaaD